jgi:hypothetical protein
MKTTIIFLVLLFSTTVHADVCSVAIRDRNGFDALIFTRSSYSINAACDNAHWDCLQKLSDLQSRGFHYNSFCTITLVPLPIPPVYPPPYPIPYPSPYPYPNYPNFPHYPNYPRPPHGPGWPHFPNHPHWPRWPGRGPR